MLRTAVCGTTREPDSTEPDAIAVALQFLNAIGVPQRKKGFTPSQLATDVGGSRRSWQRACVLGNIGAVRVPGGWLVPWDCLVRYFAANQNLVSLN